MKGLIPTPSMAVALLALIVALSGSAYAVSKIGTNQIKNNAVTTPKLKNAAVTAAKIRKGAVPVGLADVETSPDISLTALSQTMVSRDLQVKAGKRYLLSGLVGVRQTSAGSDTTVRCEIYARLEGSQLALLVTPFANESLGTVNEAAQIPLFGEWDNSGTPGLYTLALNCRKTGAGDVTNDSRTLQIWELPG